MASNLGHAFVAVERRGVETATGERIVRMETVIEPPGLSIWSSPPRQLADPEAGTRGEGVGT